jgi:hypothetical protein
MWPISAHKVLGRYPEGHTHGLWQAWDQDLRFQRMFSCSPDPHAKASMRFARPVFKPQLPRIKAQQVTVRLEPEPR